jgi:hypothetical protein
VGVLGDVLVDRREDMVRDDPRVRQAEKIAEAAKLRLLTAVNATDVRESWRLMGIFGRAVLLQGETEDEVRVRVGLLSPDEAALRRLARRDDIADPAGERGSAGPVVLLLTMAATWLAALAARREARRGARSYARLESRAYAPPYPQPRFPRWGG